MNTTNNQLLTFVEPGTTLAAIFTMSSGHQITVTQSPTANCQMWSIGSFYILLQFPPKDFKEVLLDVYTRSGGKRILLVDIKNQYASGVVKKFNNHIIGQLPYKSTNGSDMTIMLINIYTWFEEEQNKMLK